MQVTLWIQPVSQLLAESFINNQFSASLAGYPSLFFTLRERALEASLAWVSKLHTNPLKMTPLYRFSLQRWIIRTKTRFRESNSQKASSVTNIFTWKHILQLGSLMVMTTDRLLWNSAVPHAPHMQPLVYVSAVRTFPTFFFLHAPRVRFTSFLCTPHTCVHLLSLCPWALFVRSHFSLCTPSLEKRRFCGWFLCYIPLMREEKTLLWGFW